ncbi:MAG TPA: stage V sporulation protein E [Candidatus Atribacteria bacterium]|nr:stage V sporulation protein E [Candidatus Atribacteria bacterium]
MTKKPVDFPILITTVILVAIGIVMVFSASYYRAAELYKDSLYFFKRQLLWAVVGFAGMFLASRIEYRKLKKFSVIFLVISILLLVAVLLVGEVRNNAKRWLSIGGFSLQPSEIAKFALILFTADIASRSKHRFRKFFTGLVPVLGAAALMAGLIMLQPNMSTAMSILMMALILLFVGGANLWHLSLLVGAGGAAGVALMFSAGYRLKRFLGFLDPWADPLETGFQIIQSLYALGSGGLFGLGIAQSRQKLLYLPYPETDFIFAIIGEELGFVGGLIIILLFITLIWRGIRVAITAPDMFGTMLSAGIIIMITVQVVINIAVVTNSMPPTGLPLPFISYGGSSLAMLLTSIGVLLNISKYSKAS